MTVVTIDVADAFICEGGTASFTSNVLGGIGSAAYQWQYNDSISGWTDIAGATNSSLDEVLAVPGTYEYRVGVIMSQGCDKISNSLLVTVYNDATISIALNESEVCVGAFVNLTATISDGSDELSYYWQSSPDGTTDWTDVGPANTDYVVPTGTPGTYYYRARISDLSSGCAE